MKMKKTNLIKDETYQLALDVIQLYVKLRDQKEFVVPRYFKWVSRV